MPSKSRGPRAPTSPRWRDRRPDRLRLIGTAAVAAVALAAGAFQPAAATAQASVSAPTARAGQVVAVDSAAPLAGPGATMASPVMGMASTPPVIPLLRIPRGHGARTATGEHPAGPQDLGLFTVTCYSLGGHTATGAKPSEDVVAVDPAVIPLGSRIVVDGVGARVASDTGGAIKGHRLDVWKPSAAECASFGVQRLEAWRPAT
jgi:3D (Asp-Asp-Asp) domain-containing protein